MVFIQRLIVCNIIICLSSYPTKAKMDTALEIEKNSQIIAIDSVQEVANKVKSFCKKDIKGKEICVVWDFHGVIVKH